MSRILAPITPCPIEFMTERSGQSHPIILVGENDQSFFSEDTVAATWAKANHFTGKCGDILIVPDNDGTVSKVYLGFGDGNDVFAIGNLFKQLPEGDWHFEHLPENALNLFLGLALGSYKFARYLEITGNKKIRITLPADIDKDELKRLIETTFFVRDLINTPTNDMQPDTIEEAIRELGRTYSATVTSIWGDDLLKQNFPMVHAVGRAGSVAPRVIDLRWGDVNHPKVTLVGKGVAFDSGGLDIKSANGMLLMKKDMGGAANVMGLAKLIMDAKLPIRLRLIVPAVENSISGNAFRPGDVLKSRKGLTVEIGNTDAEGRLILADALAYGDEEKPDYLFDMATLTGAARVALGPDVPPFYCNNDELGQIISRISMEIQDPLWQLPLWKPYQKKLSSRIADLNNVTTDGFAGSITAALFLQKFVDQAVNWAHFDIYGWTPAEKPAFPVGGEAQGIRALYTILKGL